MVARIEFEKLFSISRGTKVLTLKYRCQTEYRYYFFDTFLKGIDTKGMDTIIHAYLYQNVCVAIDETLKKKVV